MPVWYFFIHILLVFGNSPAVHPDQSMESVQFDKDISVMADSVVDHATWDFLLKRYVDEQGGVDYEGFMGDSLLGDYLTTLSNVDPGKLDREEALAYWINAYNAFTIKLVVDHYPVNSILNITPLKIKGLRLAIPRFNTPFKIKVATINGERMSLDHMEHGILRKEFDEPRIHFAIVCASASCPPLRNEAYVPAHLDAQLDDQARIFLQDEYRNSYLPAENELHLSRIFKWFAEDFGATEAERLEFIKGYMLPTEAEQVNGQTTIRYKKYSWDLNRQF